MRASETERGVTWLSNFQALDQPTARLLLDALELVGQDELRIGLGQLLYALGTKMTPPIALVPVRELDAGQSYFGHDRNAKPRLLNANSLPGSEAIVANIINGLRREALNSGPFVATPSLRNMREAKARTIVFVDDFSGSGDRIIKFHRGFRRHATLQSWKSYGLIDFHVAVYSATRRAKARLDRTFGADRVHVHRICPTFASRRWRAEEHARVEAFCRKYACPKAGSYPLGYDDSRGLMAFSHSAPNNMPAVLWQRRGRGPGWRPFFADKAVPVDLAPLFSSSGTERRTSSALARMGQAKLAASLETTFPPLVWQKALLVLAAVATNPRDDVRISELTGLSLADTLATIATTRNNGLVTDVGLHLTDLGRSELRHARDVDLPSVESRLKPSTDPYYPQSLRVGP